ncbi:MAG TPA: hypothetical protein VGP94_14410, partial [Tepidisphaeraceae bacterium]|nr:hypothetical protein [Tepidisphaeraceae bacterium]
PTHPHTPLLLMFAFGLAIAASGFFIHTRRSRIFSMIIAAILCLMFPIGTILGLFTLPVLARGSVGTLYRARRQNPA